MHANHACTHHVSPLPLKLTPWLRLYLRRCFGAFTKKVTSKSSTRERQLWLPMMQICCLSFCLSCNNIKRTEIMLWACSCLQCILKELLANSEAETCSFLFLQCHLWMMEENRSDILSLHCVPVPEKWSNAPKQGKRTNIIDTARKIKLILHCLTEFDVPGYTLCLDTSAPPTELR